MAEPEDKELAWNEEARPDVEDEVAEAERLDLVVGVQVEHLDIGEEERCPGQHVVDGGQNEQRRGAVVDQ